MILARSRDFGCVAATALILGAIPWASAVTIEAHNSLTPYGWLAADYNANPIIYGHNADAVNNLVYLQNQWPTVYHGRLTGSDTTAWRATAGPLYYDTRYMWFTRLGSSDWWGMPQDYIWGLRNWIEDKAPGVTAYKGQGIIPIAGVPQFDWTTDRPQPAWFSAQDVTFDFLYKALSSHSAVHISFMDMGTSPYFNAERAITGISWTDTNGNGKIDQGEAQLWYIDPFDVYDSSTGHAKQKSVQLWMGYNSMLNRQTLMTDYTFGRGPTWIEFAVSTAAVPEPASLGALTLVSGLLCLRRRRRG